MNFGNINIDDLSSYSVQELQVNITQNFSLQIRRWVLKFCQIDKISIRTCVFANR